MASLRTQTHYSLQARISSMMFCSCKLHMTTYFNTHFDTAKINYVVKPTLHEFRLLSLLWSCPPHHHLVWCHGGTDQSPNHLIITLSTNSPIVHVLVNIHVEGLSLSPQACEVLSFFPFKTELCILCTLYLLHSLLQ